MWVIFLDVHFCENPSSHTRKIYAFIYMCFIYQYILFSKMELQSVNCD